jgi:hypothetical protein
MRVAILQPSYLPWLGYFEQIHHADLFIFLNDVQYTKSDWRNRNRIKTPRGIAWITVPVRRQGLQQRICETCINHATPWPERHVNLLREHYRKAPHFEAVMDVIGPHLAARPLLLQDLAIGLVLDLAKFMGIPPNTVRSSDLGVRETDRNGRLIAMCRRVGATELYESAAGRAYMDVARFAAAGVRVVFQDYRHPTYRQFFGPFVSHLSVVDLLFHYGPDARQVVISGHGEHPDIAVHRAQPAERM